MSARDLNAAELSAAIDRAARLLASDPATAEREIRAVLRQTPQDPRAGLILASARRRQGHVREARNLLEPLARAFPRAALTHYELGASLAAMDQWAAALASLRHAVSLNRDLTEAWRTIGDILFRQGDVAGAETAFAEQARAAVTDPRLKPAADALFRGALAEAEQALRAHLAAAPSDASALRLLAEVFTRQERFPDAESLLARAVALDPEQAGGRFSYAVVLFRQQNAGASIPIIEDLLLRTPDEPAYLNLLAANLSLIGADAQAIDIYARLLDHFPRQPRIWLNYGHALKTVGRQAEAVDAYRKTIALAPGAGDAYWGLANLKIASFGKDDEAAMSVQLMRGDLTSEDRLHLHFAMGKALEDAGDYADAFSHYARGAEIRRLAQPFDADENHRFVEASRRWLDAPLFEQRKGWGCPAPDPIFIVGLPRSGSTLIEQILASHSLVQGTMELPTLGFMASELDRKARQEGLAGYPQAIPLMDEAALTALGEGFLASTRIYRTLDRPLFIDKMPNNFRHVGLIQLILPNARIIDARRQPLGSCFSSFKQHFAQGQSFSYDLTDLGRYYADYVELMRHYDRALPGRVHRVIYEDMVEDTEGVVRQLLDYCGLPFEEGCLRFYENQRAVRTVSSEQVRRPIFREGLDQWKRFDPWLGPLKAALGPVLENWRA